MTKKVLSAMLAVVMCVSLTACGGGKENSNHEGSDHEELLQMLENGEYESAHYYIDNLKRQEEEANKEENKESDGKESILSELYGEWLVQNAYDEDNVIESVSFDGDNTCKIGNKDYKWRINYEHESSVSLYVTEGEKKIYNAYMSTEDREQSLSLSKIIEEETGRAESIGAYRKAANYDKIEINVDNFLQYFELVEKVEFTKDSFGDVSGLSFSQYVMIKEEYLDKVSDLSKVVVELDFTYGKKSIVVDLANQTYTLGTDYELNTYDREPIKGQFYLSFEDGYPVSYKLSNSSSHYNSSASMVTDYRTDMQVLRVEGALYLMK